MIRPRCGDFVYTSLDLEVMKADIDQFRKMGITGIVLGVLSPDGTIDIPTTKR
jgi:copper homeostasis protein